MSVYQYFVVGLAIITLGLLAASLVTKGIDGQLITLVLTIIGGLAGYGVGKARPPSSPTPPANT